MNEKNKSMSIEDWSERKRIEELKTTGKIKPEPVSVKEYESYRETMFKKGVQCSGSWMVIDDIGTIDDIENLPGSDNDLNQHVISQISTQRKK